MSALQRGRMVSAAVEVIDEVGYARMTVARVIGRARVSRNAFYDVFADCQDCFLAAFEQAVSRARLLATEAYEREVGWREGMRAALASLLSFVDEEPALARLCVVEALGAGERVLERRSRLLAEVADVVDRGRLAAGARRSAPEITAEAAVGAIVSILHTHLLEGRKEPATELLGPLMSVIVLALPRSGARAPGIEQAARSKGQAHSRAVQGQRPARRSEHSPDLSHRAGSHDSRRAPQSEQSRGRRRRGHRRPGSDLQAPDTARRAGSHREPRRRPPKGSGQRVAPDGVRGAGRASCAAAVSRRLCHRFA